MLKQKNWYVVYTAPNCEKKVYNELERREIVAYMPTTKVVRQWSDRQKKLEVPLFSSYVFVRVSNGEMWKVLAVDGVVRFVSFGGQPAQVRDVELDWVKKITADYQCTTADGQYEKGDMVQVVKGPLLGLVGTISDKKHGTQLHVELKTVRRVVAISINKEFLARVNDTMGVARYPCQM